jgi:hypothetical protein
MHDAEPFHAAALPRGLDSGLSRLLTLRQAAIADPVTDWSVLEDSLDADRGVGDHAPDRYDAGSSTRTS